MLTKEGYCKVGVRDTEHFDINPIPSKYRASIAYTDTDSDTCHLKKHTFKWPTTIKN